MSQYADLLAFASQDKTNRFYQQVMLMPEHKALVCTNGNVLLAVRDARYEPALVLARVLGADNTLTYNPETDALEKSDKEAPSFARVVSSIAHLQNDTKCVRIILPAWLSHVSKRCKEVLMHITAGNQPALSVTGQATDYSVPLNLLLLKPLAGQQVDVYLPAKDSHILTILPAGQALDTAPWFCLVAPMRVPPVGAKSVTYAEPV